MEDVQDSDTQLIVIQSRCNVQPIGTYIAPAEHEQLRLVAGMYIVIYIKFDL